MSVASIKSMRKVSRPLTSHQCILSSRWIRPHGPSMRARAQRNQCTVRYPARLGAACWKGAGLGNENVASKAGGFAGQRGTARNVTLQHSTKHNAHLGAAVGDHPVERSEEECKGTEPSEQQEGVEH